MKTVYTILLFAAIAVAQQPQRVQVVPLGGVKLPDVREPVGAAVDAAGNVYVLHREAKELSRSILDNHTWLRKYDASGRLIQKIGLGASEGVSLAISDNQLLVGLVTPRGTEIAQLSTEGERLRAIDMNNVVPLKIFPGRDGTIHVVGFDRGSSDLREQYAVRKIGAAGAVVDKQFPVPSREAARMTLRNGCFALMGGQSLIHIGSDGTVRDASGKQYRLELKSSPLPSFVPADATKTYRIWLASYEQGKLLISAGESISYRDATGQVKRLVRDYLFVFDKNGKLLATSGPVTASPTLRGEDGYYYILGHDENGQVNLVKFRIEVPNH